MSATQLVKIVWQYCINYADHTVVSDHEFLVVVWEIIDVPLLMEHEKGLVMVEYQ